PNGNMRQVRLFRGHNPQSPTEEMKNKIDTPEGRRTYQKRISIVEPVFANIRTHKKMDRFTLRGRFKVRIQWLLYCMVHNLEKIANYGISYKLPA
ncbi:MAG: transposase, partial [Verrucomicrobiota bacterium]